MLAYKEGHLFVIEAKQGLGTNEYNHASILEARDLEGKAEYQLVKSCDFIKENWEAMKDGLSINDNISFSDITLLPLIVTNYYEADQKTFRSFNKTTLVELDVILNNRKRDLLETYLIMQNSLNRNNPEFIGDNLEIDWDLGSVSISCYPPEIMKCIKDNFVWKELEQTWKFQDAELRLDF